MITSRHPNVIQNQNTVIGNLSFENVEKFRYLGLTVTNGNDIHKEIKRRINMGNACYYSLEKIWNHATKSGLDLFGKIHICLNRSCGLVQCLILAII